MTSQFKLIAIAFNNTASSSWVQNTLNIPYNAVYLPTLSSNLVTPSIISDSSLPSDNDLKTRWRDIVGGDHDESINKYMDELQVNGYTSEQKSVIYQNLLPFTKLDPIRVIELNFLKEILEEPKCPIRQENSFKLFGKAQFYPLQTNTLFEQYIKFKIVDKVQQLEWLVLDYINRNVFYGAKDHQNSHALEPIRVRLDQRFGLYGGQYLEDVHNSSSELTRYFIDCSIDDVLANGYRFSLHDWVNEMHSYIQKDTTIFSSLIPYLNHVLEKSKVAGHLGKKLYTELEVELEERSCEIGMGASAPLFLPDDYDLILKNPITGSLFPSKRLILLLLQHVLLAPKPRPTSSPSSISIPKIEETQGRSCLRHGIPEFIIRVAHANYDEVLTKLKNIPDNWTNEQLVLFLHIVMNRFPTRLEEEQLSLSQDRLNQADSNGETSLFIACLEGHEEVARLLLANNASVNLANKDRFTALSIACHQGHEPVVRLLLEGGASVDQPMNDGSTPLFIACYKGHEAVARLLLDNGVQVDQAKNDGSTPLLVACQEGHTAIVKLLLANKAQVDLARTSDGTTPLFIACQNGHEAVARLLLDNGAQVNKAADDGTTPLFIAAHEGHLEVVRLLLEAKASVDLSDKDRFTPLFIACLEGHEEVARLLLANNASVNLANKDRFTPLYIACQNGNEEVARLLLANNASVNLANKEGFTALSIACHQGHEPVVKLLLEGGAQVDQVMNDGITPLFIACQEGHTAIVKLLKEAGAKLSLFQKVRLRAISIKTPGCTIS